MNTEYDVHLDTFEGPLDLLLHLVRKTDLEIQEIQVSEITTEYLSYLDTLEFKEKLLLVQKDEIQNKMKYLISIIGLYKATAGNI